MTDTQVATIASALRLATLPYDAYNIASGVRLSGTTIEAGDVTLTSEATDAGLGLDLPPYIENAFTLLPIVQELLKVSVPDLTSFKGLLPPSSCATRRLKRACTMTSSSRPAMWTWARPRSGRRSWKAAAGATPKGATKNLQVAIGIGRAGANAYAALTGRSSILAGGSVKLTAEGEASSISTAIVDNFEGIFDPVTGKASKKYDGKNVSLALAYADTNLKTQAILGSSASITSTGGNVNIAANGSAESAASSSTISYIQGLAGVNLSLNLDNSDIDTRIDGAITAAGGLGSGKGTFDGADKIDEAANTIAIKDHGFLTGEQVVYKAAGDFGNIQGSSRLSVGLRMARPTR